MKKLMLMLSFLATIPMFVIATPEHPSFLDVFNYFSVEGENETIALTSSGKDGDNHTEVCPHIVAMWGKYEDGEIADLIRHINGKIEFRGGKPSEERINFIKKLLNPKMSIIEYWARKLKPNNLKMVMCDAGKYYEGKDIQARTDIWHQEGGSNRFVKSFDVTSDDGISALLDGMNKCFESAIKENVGIEEVLKSKEMQDCTNALKKLLETSTTN